jgi:hypothetical protein
MVGFELELEQKGWSMINGNSFPKRIGRTKKESSKDGNSGGRRNPECCPISCQERF